jgi:hypothetical protein
MTTTKRFRVLPYSPYSNSARLLAEGLSGKRIKLQGSRYKYSEGDVVINWGNSKPPPYTCTLNNDSTCMTIVQNKLYFFENNKDSDWLPEFWTNPEEIPDDAFPIVCRTVLNGHSGQGIVLSDTRDDLVSCPLYVKYIPKKDEYRVHLGLNTSGDVTVIAIQQKKRKLEHDEPNWKIRNHANGFVYAREGVDPPSGVLDVSHDCFLHSGLDFGAVDLGYHPDHGIKAYEINTAPGLEGQTLEDYVRYFKDFA